MSIRFCEDCGNMLTPLENPSKKVLSYECKMCKIKGIENAEDLAEYLPELKERWIDGVLLDNWENELVVINRDIIWKSEKAFK